MVPFSEERNGLISAQDKPAKGGYFVARRMLLTNLFALRVGAIRSRPGGVLLASRSVEFSSLAFSYTLRGPKPDC